MISGILKNVATTALLVGSVMINAAVPAIAADYPYPGTITATFRHKAKSSIYLPAAICIVDRVGTSKEFFSNFLRHQRSGRRHLEWRQRGAWDS
jgi:hypothetical protein